MENIKRLKFDTEDVLDAFRLNRTAGNCEQLNKLCDFEPNFAKAEILEERRQALITEGDFWNEEELKMKFLAGLFEVADLEVTEKIKTFYERSLEAIVGEYKLSVVCDMLLATPKGIGKPKKPFFFLQEFKKAKNAPDAEGQMLTAMLIAQSQNDNNKTVYGCWIQGKFWNFCALHEKKYCVGETFDATKKDELAKIISILEQLKQVILTELAD
jgi:hypothetical protein